MVENDFPKAGREGQGRGEAEDVTRALAAQPWSQGPVHPSLRAPAFRPSSLASLTIMKLMGAPFARACVLAGMVEREKGPVVKPAGLAVGFWPGRFSACEACYLVSMYVYACVCVP